jgi:hypothetical protein
VLIASGARNKFVFSPPNQCRDGYAVVCTLGVGDTSGSPGKAPGMAPFYRAPKTLGEMPNAVHNRGGIAHAVSYIAGSCTPRSLQAPPCHRI